MKALVLVVSADPLQARRWTALLTSQFHVTNAAPEDAMFRMLEARFAAVVICHSVIRRKLLPLLAYLHRTAPAVPVVLLRTGRERQKIKAAEVVLADSESSLVEAVRRATSGGARGVAAAG